MIRRSFVVIKKNVVTSIPKIGILAEQCPHTVERRFERDRDVLDLRRAGALPRGFEEAAYGVSLHTTCQNLNGHNHGRNPILEAAPASAQSA
jgi:hypothetical protein